MPKKICNTCAREYWDDRCPRCAVRDWAAKMETIAGELNKLDAGTWTFRTEPGEYDEYRSVGLARAEDGMEIALLRRWANGGKTTAMPRTPPNPVEPGRNALSYYLDRNEATPEASFNPDRPPAAIARDIKRRVIDPYAEILPRVRARIADMVAKNDAAELTAKRVAEVMDGDIRKDRGSDIYVYGNSRMRLSVRISRAGYVEIDRWSINLDNDNIVDIVAAIKAAIDGTFKAPGGSREPALFTA